MSEGRKKSVVEQQTENYQSHGNKFLCLINLLPPSRFEVCGINFYDNVHLSNFVRRANKGNRKSERKVVDARCKDFIALQVNINKEKY